MAAIASKHGLIDAAEFQRSKDYIRSIEKQADRNLTEVTAAAEAEINILQGQIMIKGQEIETMLARGPVELIVAGREATKRANAEYKKLMSQRDIERK